MITIIADRVATVAPIQKTTCTHTHSVRLFYRRVVTRAESRYRPPRKIKHNYPFLLPVGPLVFSGCTRNFLRRRALYVQKCWTNSSEGGNHPVILREPNDRDGLSAERCRSVLRGWRDVMLCFSSECFWNIACAWLFRFVHVRLFFHGGSANQRTNAGWQSVAKWLIRCLKTKRSFCDSASQFYRLTTQAVYQ